MECVKAVVHMGHAGEERRMLQAGENENRWNTSILNRVSPGGWLSGLLVTSSWTEQHTRHGIAWFIDCKMFFYTIHENSVAFNSICYEVREL